MLTILEQLPHNAIMERMIQKKIDVDGSWVTLDIYGDPDGPAIVVLPGVMADAAGWAPVAQQLEGWQTVAVINRRGRHPSGPLTDSYDLQTEVRDAEAVLREFSSVRTLFGWSYGGLILLHLANTVEIPHLIAYEPIMAPFGASALPDLKSAHADGDINRVVEVALEQVTGMPGTVIESLRADTATWAGMRAVSSPLYAETQSLNNAPEPDEFARKATRIDLIVGERNRGQSPYGTTFDDVARRTSRGTVHELAGQAHLAHLEAPDRLAALVNDLRVKTA
jgi:pimeloyl-ACP methyl ester carboxylesterase